MRAHVSRLLPVVVTSFLLMCPAVSASAAPASPQSESATRISASATPVSTSFCKNPAFSFQFKRWVCR